MKESQIIELPDFCKKQLKCSNDKRIKMLCSNPKCSKIGLQCMEENCEKCQKDHMRCRSVYFNSVLERIRQRRLPLQQRCIQMFQQMDKYYLGLIEKIEKDRQLNKDRQKYFGLSDEEIQFLSRIQKNQQVMIDGRLLSKILVRFENSPKVKASTSSLQKFWKDKTAEFDRVLHQGKRVMVMGYDDFDSVITQKQSLIESFFKSKVHTITLLYRASENNFSVASFHTKCSGIKNTLTIAKTNTGKIVGGFTPSAWLNGTQYIGDKKMLSFLFSLSNKLLIPLKSNKKKFATYCASHLGPTFGQNNQFSIPDNSKNTEVSLTFGQSYNNQQNNRVTQEQLFNFSGSPNHRVKFVEWEVYQVRFK